MSALLIFKLPHLFNTDMLITVCVHACTVSYFLDYDYARCRCARLYLFMLDKDELISLDYNNPIYRWLPIY
jgi:hypothetical protein